MSENLKTARRAGYEVVGHFTLPDSAWWADYYLPLEERLRGLRLNPHHAHDPVMSATIDETQREIDLYRKYSDIYGYVFYVLRLL